MSNKEITALSSVDDRFAAAQELQSANSELSQWIDDYRNDPNSPREIYEGKDYGVFLTVGMINAQARVIANNYDYIAYGSKPIDNTNTQALEIQIGGDDFYIRGDGIEPGSAPQMPTIEDGLLQLNDTQLGSGFITSTETNSTDSTFTTSAPALSAPADTDSFSAGIETTTSDIFPQPSFQNNPGAGLQPISADDQTSLFPGTSTPILTTNTSSPSTPILTTNTSSPSGGLALESDIDDVPQYYADPVNSNIAISTDDSGSVSGTGNESGYVDTSTIGGIADASAGGVDPERPENPFAAGQAGATTATADPLEPFGGAGGDVDVTQYGRTKDVGNSIYEPNIADLPLLPNVLHKYTNWTYNASWYMLTPESHESIVKNGGITNPASELRNLLMRSGSTGRAGALGQKGDYYIENLRFTTIFGQNSKTTKSSNNFDIRFEVVEPYGVAFLSELIQLAQSQSIDDHFDIPYLLELKFKGYDDYGNIVNDIPGSGPKYIPLKIINITFKIVSGATVYSIQAVPYAHSPLQNQWSAYIQESISVKGSTFEELMGSLFEYLNNSEQNKAKEQSRIPDEFKFVIHDNDLKSSSVGFVHKTQGSTAQIDRLSMDPGENNKEFVQITGGSTLKSAVQAIASATDFGAKFNTVGQPESNADNVNKPFRLLKIVPVVTKLGKYNTSTKQYSKTIVYKIETQKMYGFVLPDMPGAKPAQRGWQKEYNWIFTGKNQDIIDFEADYNIQYFNIRNSFVDQKGKVTGTPAANSSNLPDDGISRTDAGGKVYSPAIVTASSPLTDSVQNSYRGAAFQLAADHMDNILNNPGADMISIDLKIIGDPDWIAQDKSILPSVDSSSGNDRTVNGSIAIDNHDVFFMLRFKTPRDYDANQGLMQIETEQTFVQGLYRVITCESNFYDGKFEQTLKAIRVQDQVSNDPANIPELTRGYTGLSTDNNMRDNTTASSPTMPFKSSPSASVKIP